MPGRCHFPGNKAAVAGVRSSRFPRASVSFVKKTFADLGIRPRKQWSQNFLIDEAARDRILDAGSLSVDDRVLEIGPGLGALTEVLAERVSYLLAIEKDRGLHQYLESAFRSQPTVELKLGDALKLGFEKLGRFDRCVSNLPYSCGTRILVNWIQAQSRPEGIVVTIQQEVARRILAQPGSRDYGPLAIWSQLHYDVAILGSLSPSSFWPQPDVHSSVVQMRRLASARCAVRNPAFFYRLTREAFLYRRKQLGTVLRHLDGGLVPADAGEQLVKAGIDPVRRPEKFSIEEWGDIANILT